jgi:hypothetical protein
VEEVIQQRGEILSLASANVLEKIGIALARVFGCRHRQMSLPFTRGSLTYRTCVACGARRDFDLDQRVMIGPYYYPTIR